MLLGCIYGEVSQISSGIPALSNVGLTTGTEAVMTELASELTLGQGGC